MKGAASHSSLSYFETAPLFSQRQDLLRLHPHKVSLSMFTHRACRRRLEPDMHMAAVQAHPRRLRIAFKQRRRLRAFRQLAKPVAVNLLNRRNHLKRLCRCSKALFAGRLCKGRIDVARLLVFIALSAAQQALWRPRAVFHGIAAVDADALSLALRQKLHKQLRMLLFLIRGKPENALNPWKPRFSCRTGGKRIPVARLAFSCKRAHQVFSRSALSEFHQKSLPTDRMPDRRDFMHFLTPVLQRPIRRSSSACGRG